MIGALAGTDRPAAGALITDRSWFDRPALEVAPDLPGMLLIHDTPDGRIVGRLVEVEASGWDFESAVREVRVWAE